MNQRVTLNGINRRGLANWKGRERWISKNVRIWSDEHKAWWRPNCQGYTAYATDAGIYTFSDAWDATSHCGPEKKIVYEAVR
jgi:hypothetical protein